MKNKSADKGNHKSAVFITFNGNCKAALQLYQACFGGVLHFDTFDKPIEGTKAVPVISGCLSSGKVTIYGSDLVHDQGRRIGNHMAVYIQCGSHQERVSYLQQLAIGRHYNIPESYMDQKLIETTDLFDVIWVFGV